MSERIVKGIQGMVEEVKVYDLDESIKASKYPMAVRTAFVDEKITDTVKKLGTSPLGSGHGNFLNGIRIAFDLTLTNKVWTEFQRYHFADFVSSQSTMHRISKFELSNQYSEYTDKRIIAIMKELKNTYNRTNDPEDYLKLLYSNPAGFKLTARITTNYGQLKTMYKQRKDHRLPEWRIFCEWMKSELPYFRNMVIGE